MKLTNKSTFLYAVFVVGFLLFLPNQSEARNTRWAGSVNSDWFDPVNLNQRMLNIFGVSEFTGGGIFNAWKTTVTTVERHTPCRSSLKKYGMHQTAQVLSI